MSIISLICFALIIAYFIKWWKNSGDSFYSRFPKIEITVLSVIGLIFYLPTINTYIAAYKAETAIEKLVGFRVTYNCGSMYNAFFDRNTDFAGGYVRFNAKGVPEHRSKLPFYTCDFFKLYLSNPNKFESDKHKKAYSIMVFTHEAMHMTGEMDESKTECKAIQRLYSVARELGSNPEVAKNIVDYYYEQIYPKVPPPYFSGECKKGGLLDEDLPTSPWNLRY